MAAQGLPGTLLNPAPFRPAWLTGGWSLIIFSGIAIILGSTSFAPGVVAFLLAAAVYQLILGIQAKEAPKPIFA